MLETNAVFFLANYLIAAALGIRIGTWVSKTKINKLEAELEREFAKNVEDHRDELFQASIEALWEEYKRRGAMPFAMAAYLRHVFGLGHTRSTRIILQLAREGYVSEPNTAGNRWMHGRRKG